MDNSSEKSNGSSWPQGAHADVDAVVIGAGFSGLFMAHRLRGLGLRVQGFEAAPDVGGTWTWNRYPGARTDSLHAIYRLHFDKDFARDWAYSERYPAQSEVQAYLSALADRFELRALFRFSTTVTAASFDEATGLWTVQTDTGDSLTASLVITAVGLLSAPNSPPFPGAESFTGQIVHSSRWPVEDVDFTGKRVAIVGTGSTGVQMIPIVAEQAERVTVFQRTPNYVVPIQNRDLTPEEIEETRARMEEIRQQVRTHPFAMAFTDPGVNAFDVSDAERRRVYQEGWEKGGFYFLFETFSDLQLDPRANETACEFIREKIRSIVQDAATAELLCPKGYSYGSKRPPAGTNYYETYNRDNVALVDVSSSPIRGFTTAGLRTEDQSWDFDIVVLATGFDAATGSLTRMDVRGRDGMSLAEKWRAGPLTNMGFSTAGFPNFLMITGPLAPFANIPTCIEENVEWLTALLEHMQSNGAHYVEATEAAEKAWAVHAEEVAHMTVAAAGEKVNTWFAGANIEGKAHAINVYFGGANNYFDACDAAAAQGYEGFTFSNRSA